MSALYSGLKIRVTSLKDPNSFYAQIGSLDQLDSFDRFTLDINEWASRCTKKLTCYPGVGLYILVKSNLTASWRRAIVREKLDNCVKVFLIDEGEELVISSLDQLCGESPPTLLSFPQQALHCHLVDIQQQTEWSELDIVEFRNLMDHPELLCTVYELSSDEMWPIVIYHKVEGVWKSIGTSLETLGISKSIHLSEIESQLEKMNISTLPNHPLHDIKMVSSEKPNELSDSTSVCTQPNLTDSETSVTDDNELSNTVDVIINSEKYPINSEKNQIDNQFQSSSSLTDDTLVTKTALNPLPTPSPSSLPVPYSSRKIIGVAKFDDSSSDSDDLNDADWDDSLLTGTTMVQDTSQDNDLQSGLFKQQNNNNNELSNDKSTEPPSQSGNIPSGSYMSDTGSSCKRYSNSKIITNNSQWSHCRNESSFKPFNDDYKQYGHGQKQQFKRDAQPHFKKFHREGNNTLPSLGRGRGHSYCSKFKSPQYRTSCSEQRSVGSSSHPPDSLSDASPLKLDCEMHSIPQKQQLGGLATTDAIKNETDWLTFKIESEMKKILPSVSDTRLLVGNISVILDGPSSHKLSGISTDTKPFVVVISVVFKWYMSKLATSDNTVSIFHDLCMSYNERFCDVFLYTCQEVFSENCEKYYGSDASEKRRMFCFLLGELYLCGITMKTSSFVDLIVKCVCGLFSKWTINMAKKNPNKNDCVTYVDCLCILCSLMGVSLDRENRETLDNYFQNLIPQIITGNHLNQSLKLQLLDLLQKRNQWLYHLFTDTAGNKNIQSSEWNRMPITTSMPLHSSPTVASNAGPVTGPPCHVTKTLSCQLSSPHTSRSSHVTGPPSSLTGSLSSFTSHVAGPFSPVTRPQDHYAGSQDRFAGSQDRFAGSPSHATGPFSPVTRPQDHYAGSQDHFAGSPSHVTGSPSHVTGPFSPVTRPQDHFAGSQGHGTGPFSPISGPPSSLSGLLSSFTGPQGRVTRPPSPASGPLSPLSPSSVKSSSNSINTDSCYQNVSFMLNKLGLGDLLDMFKSAKIQDSLLSSEKQELKEVLKDARIPPGAILSILKYLECGGSSTCNNYSGRMSQPPPPADNEQSHFGQVKFCVMCGSNNHLGYLCPNRSELLFGRD